MSFQSNGNHHPNGGGASNDRPNNNNSNNNNNSENDDHNNDTNNNNTTNESSSLLLTNASRSKSESKMVTFADDSYYGSTNPPNGSSNANSSTNRTGPLAFLLRKTQSERTVAENRQAGGGGNNNINTKKNHHHRRKTSLEDVTELWHNVTQNIQHAVVQEYQELQELWHSELQAAEEEEDYYHFFDMGLASTLSILPEDIVEASYAAASSAAGAGAGAEESQVGGVETMDGIVEYDDDEYDDEYDDEEPAILPPPPPPLPTTTESIPEGQATTPGSGGTELLISPYTAARRRQQEQHSPGTILGRRPSPRQRQHRRQLSADSQRTLLLGQRMSSSKLLSKHMESSKKTVSQRRLQLMQQQKATPSLTASARLLVEHALTIPLSAYLCLASAVISLALMGPFLELQEDVGPILKVYWRTSVTAVILFPYAVYALYQEYQTTQTLTVFSMTWMQGILVLLTSFAYTIVCDFFVLALEYTSIGNAVILSNTVSLMLLIGKFCTGSPVSWLETSGALIAFSGAIFCSKDSSDVAPMVDEDNDGQADTNISLTYLGDFYALVAAVGGVGYLIFAKRVRSFLNLHVFMFCNMFLSAWYSLIYLCLLNHTIVVVDNHNNNNDMDDAVVDNSQQLQQEPFVTFDMNVNHGILGWMHWNRFDRLWLEILMVLLCNIVGALGFIQAMQYFDTLVIAVCSLIKPVVAELMACLLGVGFLPGWKGWLGNFLVMFGTFAVVYKPPPASVKTSLSNGKNDDLH